MKNGTPHNLLKTLSSAAAMASAVLLLTAPVSSIAGSFSFDGVKDAPGGPDSYTESFAVKWFDAHGTDKTPYTKWQGDDPGETPTIVHYGKGTDGGSGDTYSWLFLEVPLIAKSMIYGAGFHTEQDKLDYGKDSMSFGDATGSEAVLFGSTDLGDGKDAENGQVFVDFADNAFDDKNNDWMVIDYMDSVDWLLGAGSFECGGVGSGDPGIDCEARNRTMSFEIKLAALDPNAGGGDPTPDFDALKSALQTNGLAFHLSPEGVVDVDMSEIPVPAAFWLFGSALIGFIGFSRRTNLG